MLSESRTLTTLDAILKSLALYIKENDAIRMSFYRDDRRNRFMCYAYCTAYGVCLPMRIFVKIKPYLRMRMTISAFTHTILYGVVDADKIEAVLAAELVAKELSE